MKTAKRLAALAAVALFLAAGMASGETAGRAYADGVVSTGGAIRVPDDFRTRYVMLGAWSVVGDADTGGATGLHVVYAPPAAVDAYRRTGRFPDGAVLVKELFNGRTRDLTTGRATAAADTAGYFVMVKDTQGRFAGSPLWGDGWGWSFFKAENTERTVSTDYKADCLGCHEPARASDIVYDDAYPVLRRR